MEDVLRELTIAHRSSRLALIAVLAGWITGGAAVVSADEGASFSHQTVSGARLLPPRALAPASLDQSQKLQSRAELAPPIRLAASTRTSPRELGPADDTKATERVPATASFTPQRLVEQAAQQLAKAEASLRRRASYSAKASATESLRLVAEARDYAQDQTTAAADLGEGLTAIRESADFIGRYGPVDPGDISRIVDSHRTKTLKEADVTHLNGASAADIYLSTARERLASIAMGNPVATRALIVLADIYRQEKALGPHADAIALNLLRAAMQSTPSDPALANELGFLLLKQGILEEAQWALERSMAITPTVSAAQNLAEVMRQRGNLKGAGELVAWLNDPQGILATPAQPPSRPTVQTLTPTEFAALSRPQQAFVPSAAGSIAAPTIPPSDGAAHSSGRSVQGEGGEGFPPAETPVPQTAPATGPIGRVAKAVSGWFQ